MTQKSDLVFKVNKDTCRDGSLVIHVSNEFGSWCVTKWVCECVSFIEKMNSSAKSDSPTTLTPAEFQATLETFAATKPIFFLHFMNFWGVENPSSIFAASYAQALEDKVDRLTAKIAQYDARFEELEARLRAPSIPSLTKASSSESNFSVLPSERTDVDELEDSHDSHAANSSQRKLGIAEKESVDDTIQEEKKKWEEVGQARDESSAEEPIDESILDCFFHSESLLAQSLASEGSSPLDSIAESSLTALYAEVDDLLKLLQPHDSQLAYRNLAMNFVAKQVRVSLNALLFDCGMHSLNCSLPTDPMKFSLPLTQQQMTHWHSSLAERLKLVAEGHAQTQRTDPNASTQFATSELERDDLTDLFQANIRHLSVALDSTGFGILGSSAATANALNMPKISSSVGNSTSSMMVQFQLDALECQVSSNHRFDLCNVSFLQEVADLVGKDNLFKRSLLLVRCWWEYEASTFAGILMKGALSETAIAFMLVTIFNNFHTIITHPLQALVHFLREFSLFDGSSQAISLQGIVPFVDDNVPCVVRVQPHQLITQEILEKYWQMLFVHDAASAFSTIGSNATAGVYSAANSTWPPQSMSALSPAMQFKLRQTMLQSMQRTLSRFEKTCAFNIVHPFAFVNLVSEKCAHAIGNSLPANSTMASTTQQLQQQQAQAQVRRLAAIPKVLQLSCHSMLSLLDTCKTQSINASAANAVITRFLPSVSPRLASPFRPDAVHNTIIIGATGKAFFDETHYRNLLSASVNKLIETMLYTNFIAENVLSDSAILTFCADTLLVKGPLPAGELGKLLSEASTIVNLSHKLRERFGGLKKFLERFPDKFIFSNDHPFNPHVLLRSAISAENLELIDRGIFPIHLISKSARAAAAAQAAKKTVKSSAANANSNSSGSVVGSTSPQQSLSPVPTSINFSDYSSNTSPSSQYYAKPPSLPSPQLTPSSFNSKSPYSGYFPTPSPPLSQQQSQSRGHMSVNAFNAMPSDPFGPPAVLFNKSAQASMSASSGFGGPSHPPSAASHSAARLRGDFFNNNSNNGNNNGNNMNSHRYSGNYGYSNGTSVMNSSLPTGNLNPLSSSNSNNNAKLNSNGNNGNNNNTNDDYFNMNKFGSGSNKSNAMMMMSGTSSSSSNSLSGMPVSNGNMNSSDVFLSDGQRGLPSFLIAGGDESNPLFLGDYSVGNHSGTNNGSTNNNNSSSNASFSSYSFGQY